jgi:hypothetical protein
MYKPDTMLSMTSPNLSTEYVCTTCYYAAAYGYETTPEGTFYVGDDDTDTTTYRPLGRFDGFLFVEPTDEGLDTMVRKSDCPGCGSPFGGSRYEVTVGEEG